MVDGNPPVANEGGLFENADFHRAILNWLNLSGATFRDVNLRGAFSLETNFTGTRFERCNFLGANLNRANLTNAVLKDCSLVFAMMNGADLRGAKLSSCDFRGANQGEPPETPILIQLAGAIYDETTEWPVGFDPRPFGAQDGTRSLWRRPTE